MFVLGVSRLFSVIRHTRKKLGYIAHWSYIAVVQTAPGPSDPPTTSIFICRNIPYKGFKGTPQYIQASFQKIPFGVTVPNSGAWKCEKNLNKFTFLEHYRGIKCHKCMRIILAINSQRINCGNHHVILEVNVRMLVQSYLPIMVYKKKMLKVMKLAAGKMLYPYCT